MRTFIRNNLRFLALLFFIVIAGPAVYAGVAHLEPQELFSRSDMVVLGEIVSLDRTVDTTRAQLRVLRAFKGPSGVGSMLTVESLGGKVFIDETQPSFMTSQVNLLFLQKTDQAYTCTNQADGQKVIRNKNLYPYHDNSMYSVPLEDYMKLLEVLAKPETAVKTP